MITSHISYWIAFGGGLLAFLSPCMLPLLPLYLIYFGGLTVQQLNDPSSTNSKVTRVLIMNTLAFIAGFTLIFVALGATATALGQFVSRYSNIILTGSSILIIIFGLFMLGILNFSFLSRTWNLKSTHNKTTLWGAFLFGLVFSLGWTPCTGPILTSILILAGSERSVWNGMGLLLIFSGGLALPFLLSALIWGKVTSWVKWGQRYTHILEKVGGIVLIIMGMWIILKGGHL